MARDHDKEIKVLTLKKEIVEIGKQIADLEKLRKEKRRELDSIASFFDFSVADY